MFLFQREHVRFEDLLDYLKANPTNYSELDANGNQGLYYSRLIGQLLAGQDIVLGDKDRATGNLTFDLPPSFDKDSLINAIRESKSAIGIYTSGTTGGPRIHFHPVSNLIRTVKTGKGFEGAIWASAYNPSHMAFVQVFFQALLNGNLLISLYGLSPAETKAAFEKQIITNLSGTPSFYRLLDLKFAATSVQTITMGGERMDSGLSEKIKVVFPMAKLRNIYASTEAGTLLNAEGEYFSIKPELENWVKVEDNQLLVHKTLLSRELAQEKEWFETGDVVDFHEDGSSFRILGRRSDIVNVGGEKVSLPDVENRALSLTGVSDARAFAIKNSLLGNLIGIDLVLKEGKEKDEIEWGQKMSAIMPEFMTPRIINFVEELELTRTLKKKR
jgi:acyl-coenzyme A synthetase/AMP-(fatty) acid ligase